MKRVFAFAVTAVFLSTCLSVAASAAMIPKEAFYQTEHTFVLDEIQKNTYKNDLGQTVIQYSNIDRFEDENTTGQLSKEASMELAKAILKEVRGNDVLYILSEDYILEALTYQEVIETVSYIKTQEDGTCQYMSKEAMLADIGKFLPNNQNSGLLLSATPPSDFIDERTSSDGYMKLVTTAVRVKSPPSCYDEQEHYYLLSVYSQWLIEPLYTYEDVLALSYGTAIYDDSYGVYAYISESELCSVCDYSNSFYYDEIYKNDTANYNKPGANKYIEIDFPGGTGVACYVNFVKHIGSCKHVVLTSDVPMNCAYINKMKSYLQTRVSSQGNNFEVRSAYSHKWTGIGSISVSFPGPSIGFSAVSNITNYYGETLRVTYISSINPNFPSF